MQAQAIAKLRAEMNDRNNPHVKLIGEFLIQHVNKNPENAEKILVADKSIVKAIGEMKKEAQKNQVEGMGMLSDEDGYAIVQKYFGVDGKAAASDDLPDLDALLEG